MKSSEPRGFITGCDKNTEWQLYWFLSNFFKYDDLFPISVFDFGMTPEMIVFIKETFDIDAIKLESKEKGWSLKPTAMLNSPYDQTCWLDTDCEIVGNIDSIFGYINFNKLTMAVDHPWSTRRGETWHNSGVVVFEGQPKILKTWEDSIPRMPGAGDQDVLHMLVQDPLTRMVFIEDLPNKYNVLRLQKQDNSRPTDIKIYHHTGHKGNEIIRKKMNG